MINRKERIKMKNKKGITLIALIITVIVMLILASIVIASLSSEDNFIRQALGSKEDTIIESTKEYVKSSYSQVLTNPSLDKDPIDELEIIIANDNIGKKEEEQFIIKSIDKTNNKIIVEHQGFEVEINLGTLANNGKLDFSPEVILIKKYAIAFYYKDTNGEDKHITMYINKDQTIQQYLAASGQSLPKTTEWIPELVLTEPITENIIYREKIITTKTYLVLFNLDEGNISGNTIIPSIIVEEGNIITNPGTPVREHYTFNGWNPVITNPITKDTVFTAQWIPTNYTYTFIAVDERNMSPLANVKVEINGTQYTSDTAEGLIANITGTYGTPIEVTVIEAPVGYILNNLFKYNGEIFNPVVLDGNKTIYVIFKGAEGPVLPPSGYLKNLVRIFN